MKIWILSLLFLPFFNNIPLFSLEKYVDFDLIQKSTAPRLLDGGILFTLPPDTGRSAYLRTNIDNWEHDYRYVESLYGVLYCFVPYNYAIEKIVYKINIDGFWITDIYTNDIIRDDFGTELSVISMPEDAVYYKEFPVVEEVRNDLYRVQFMLKDDSYNEVNLVSSIDNWSPYSHVMRLNEDGYWIFETYVSSGEYSYYFLIDGDKKVDFQNDKYKTHKTIGTVSYFTTR